MKVAFVIAIVLLSATAPFVVDELLQRTPCAPVDFSGDRAASTVCPHPDHDIFVTITGSTVDVHCECAR